MPGEKVKSEGSYRQSPLLIVKKTKTVRSALKESVFNFKQLINQTTDHSKYIGTSYCCDLYMY